MRVGFTGTRRGMTARQTRALAVLLRSFSSADHHAAGGDALTLSAVHGDAVGSDAVFDRLCREIGIHRILWPSTHEGQRAHSEENGGSFELKPADGPLDRNRDIVDNSDLLIAAPGRRVEEVRSGTWATVRYAREEGVPVVILDP